jgi:peptidoglycan/LPS O-acetylase OafA/YrhL
VVFFVLSGFVVAYVTDTKERKLSSYALSRAARILSVTVPALVIAVGVALLIGDSSRDVLRASLLNFFFIAQSWSLGVMLQGDPPYWSLCYEVWYYAIFAAWMFPASFKGKLIGTAALCGIAGPKILVMMPCWLMGVWLYYNAPRLRLGPGAASALFATSVAVFAVFYWLDVSVAIRLFLWDHFPAQTGNLEGSNQFAGDFLLSLIVSANFLAVYYMGGGAMRWLVRNKRPIAAAASNTLSFYLYHYPALLLLQYLGVTNWVGVPLSIGACLALAPFTEHRKTALRNALRAVVARTGLLQAA